MQKPLLVPVEERVSVEVPVWLFVTPPKNVAAPVACRVLDACTFPVNVDDAREMKPAVFVVRPVSV
jgi:hypothetical protein